MRRKTSKQRANPAPGSARAALLTTSLATQEKRMNAVVTFNEMESMAAHIVRSKLFGAKDESQAISLMLLAQAEGMHPMAAIQDFDIVQGRPARKTHSILARFQSAGGSVIWEEVNGLRACGVFSHKQGGSLRVQWTFEQAKRVGLTGKDNWKNYPQAMLRARCIAEGIRAVFPGAIGGMLSVEEAQDIVIAPPKDMGMITPTDNNNLRTHWLSAVSKAQTLDALESVWKLGLVELKQAADTDLHAAFKAAVLERKAALKSLIITVNEEGKIEEATL